MDSWLVVRSGQPLSDKTGVRILYIEDRQYFGGREEFLALYRRGRQLSTIRQIALA